VVVVTGRKTQKDHAGGGRFVRFAHLVAFRPMPGSDHHVLAVLRTALFHLRPLLRGEDGLRLLERVLHDRFCLGFQRVVRREDGLRFCRRQRRIELMRRGIAIRIRGDGELADDLGQQGAVRRRQRPQDMRSRLRVELIELLVQRALSYIYTTALPQPVAAAARRAIELCERDPWRRERVLTLAARFRAAAAREGVPIMAHRRASTDQGTPLGSREILSPIQPIVLGSSQAAVSAQQQLLAAGFCVVAIRPPTVPRGRARLRVTLSAAHSEPQVDELVHALARVCERCRETVS